MRTLVLFFAVCFVLSCAAPISQTSFVYSGPNAFDKMVMALTNTGWEITVTEKSSGLLVAKKTTMGEEWGSIAAGTSAKAHVATIKFEGENVNVTVQKPGTGDPLGADKDKCDDLRDEIIKNFNEMTN